MTDGSHFLIRVDARLMLGELDVERVEVFRGDAVIGGQTVIYCLHVTGSTVVIERRSYMMSMR
jgi:hypothetical protein